jgi:hypothetical protein
LRRSFGSGSVDAAVEFVLSKRNERGRWVLEGTPGPLNARFGTRGKESKWMTFRALRMLTLTGRLKAPQPRRSSPRQIIR